MKYNQSITQNYIINKERKINDFITNLKNNLGICYQNLENSTKKVSEELETIINVNLKISLFLTVLYKI